LTLSFLVLTALLVSSFNESLGAAQIETTQSSLQAANERLNQAFKDVFEAEQAGANITRLLKQLNDAAELLAQEENIYRSGDTAGVESKADSVVTTSFQISSLAQTAKEDAQVAAQTQLSLNIALSVVGSIIIILVMILFWRFFKRRYIRHLSNMKPEIVTNEA
jgi:hypothetical protein